MGVWLCQKVGTQLAETPHLAAAFLCEKVLREVDEVLTPVRLFDTLFVSSPKNLPPDARGVVHAVLFLSFTRTSVTEPEKHPVAVRICKPSGASIAAEPLKVDLIFKPDDISKCNAVINVTLAVEEFGVHRIDVFLADKLITQIPFKLLERPEQTTIVH